MKLPLHILHVEDSERDSELVEQMLRGNGLTCEVERVETRTELLEALERANYDLILSDFTLPQFTGLQALELVHALKPEVPFIFVSGTIGEETAIQSLQDGATDYVLKHRLSRLLPAVRRALEQTHEKAMLRSMGKRLTRVRRLEAIGRLAGGLARGFNALLQRLRAQIAELTARAADPQEIARIAATLEKTTERGSALMEQLLVFARRTDASFGTLDIAARVNETSRKLKERLPAGVKIIPRFGPGLPLLFADAEQMNLILTHLILNAAAAMPAGGTITISAEVVRFDTASSSSWLIDDVHYLCLKVADTGVGMDEYARLHAFEPFFTSKPAEDNMGLGLSVVFGLMQIHSGFIDIQSELGKGTVVLLFFPLPQSSMGARDVKTIPSGQLIDLLGSGPI